MTTVRFTATARSQLRQIHSWLRREADETTADRVAASLVDRCHSLATFPNRGTPQDQFRPGLRTIPYKGRYTIGYAVLDDDVFILGICAAGQEWETVFDPSRPS